MTTIIIQPEDVWQYYLDHKDDKGHFPRIIASNEDCGIEVCIDVDKYGFAEVYVQEYDDLIDQDYIDVCCSEAVVRRIYSDYLFQGDDKYDVDEDDDDDLTEAKLREIDLKDAAADFLDVLLDGSAGAIVDRSKLAMSILDLSAEHLYKAFGISVYWPRIIEGNNSEYLSHYPYEEVYSSED